jgi:hypothetical protein
MLSELVQRRRNHGIPMDKWPAGWWAGEKRDSKFLRRRDKWPAGQWAGQKPGLFYTLACKFLRST